MQILALVLAVLGLMIVWAFFSFVPQYANKRQLSVFNWTCVGVFALLAATYLLNIDMIFTGSTLEKYRLVFMMGGTSLMALVFFAVFLLLRNFWIFKPQTLGNRYF